MKYFFLVLAIFSLSSCRPQAFKTQTISQAKAHEVAAPDPSQGEDFERVLTRALASRYQRAGSPSFAIIGGFYMLPSAKPFGAATVVRSYSYHTYFEKTEITAPARDYAIEPMSGDDALSYNKALNSLLDIGVKIKELSMADAKNIADAEEKAFKSEESFRLGKMLPPGADFLMSVYRTKSERGPVLVGRVIKGDGTLMAFKVLHMGPYKRGVGGMLVSLFEDTINRL